MNELCDFELRQKSTWKSEVCQITGRGASRSPHSLAPGLAPLRRASHRLHHHRGRLPDFHCRRGSDRPLRGAQRPAGSIDAHHPATSSIEVLPSLCPHLRGLFAFQNPEGWGCDSHIQCGLNSTLSIIRKSFRIPKDGWDQRSEGQGSEPQNFPFVSAFRKVNATPPETSEVCPNLRGLFAFQNPEGWGCDSHLGLLRLLG